MDTHIHVHVDSCAEVTPSFEELILARLTALEAIMSNTSGALSGLTEAINGVVERVDTDVAHLNDLLQQALATDVADQATIDQLRAEAVTAVDAINAATAQLSSIDPDASFPPAETPPPAQPTPADASPTQPDAAVDNAAADAPRDADVTQAPG